MVSSSPFDVTFIQQKFPHMTSRKVLSVTGISYMTSLGTDAILSQDGNPPPQCDVNGSVFPWYGIPHLKLLQ